jgi:hypothetical protein
MIPVRDQIYEAYRKAWIEKCRKINEYVAELQAWSEHKVFVIGGGSRLPLLVDTVRVHPGHQTPLQLATLEQPTDLARSDKQRITGEELPFITIATGCRILAFRYLRRLRRIKYHQCRIGTSGVSVSTMKTSTRSED